MLPAHQDRYKNLLRSGTEQDLKLKIRKLSFSLSATIGVSLSQHVLC